MKNLNKRITWFLFLLIAWLILIINGARNSQVYLNFIKELTELCKSHSKYNEDSDWELTKKKNE